MSILMMTTLKRFEVSKDRDRIGQICKDYDEQVTLVVDWTDRLASGETIATSTWTTGGPTIVSSSNTTTTSTATIKDGQGELTCKVTTSASQTLQERIRVVTKPRSDVEDYR